MPYLKTGRKREVASEPQRANTDGDFNYLYTRAYLKAFTANPSYGTIALLAKAAIDPKKHDLVERIDDLLTLLLVSDLDRKAARLLAYLEFYARIGRMYEKQCIIANGDLEEYKAAEQAIMEKFKTVTV